MYHAAKFTRLIAAALLIFAGAAQGDEVQCFPPPPVFPTFDQACGSNSDCQVAVHQIDCCGSRAALGINIDEGARFDLDEGICRDQYPACDCVDRGILADDGQSAYYEADIGVACNEGICTTFVLDE